MTKTNENDARTAAPRSYRDGLVAVVARCAPGCNAHRDAIAALAAWDAKFFVR